MAEIKLKKKYMKLTYWVTKNYAVDCRIKLLFGRKRRFSDMLLGNAVFKVSLIRRPLFFSADISEKKKQNPRLIRGVVCYFVLVAMLEEIVTQNSQCDYSCVLKFCREKVWFHSSIDCVFLLVCAMVKLHTSTYLRLQKTGINHRTT